jgi:virulence-associated protein VagC
MRAKLFRNGRSQAVRPSASAFLELMAVAETLMLAPSLESC